MSKLTYPCLDMTLPEAGNFGWHQLASLPIISALSKTQEFFL